MHNKLTFIIQLEIPIRWTDMDAYGHVNNAKYFEYMSEARIQYLEKYFLNSPFQFVVAETNCVYKKPLEYPGTVLLKLFLEEVGHSYFIIYYEFYLANDASNTLYATSMAKMVCFDPVKKRVARIPEIVLEKLKI